MKRLASGGMAEIYLARARGIEGFEKSVVLKRILPQYAADESFVQMFLHEARIAATLDHPNIATVYDIDQCEGIYFYAMEYLQGEDVGHILREVVRRGLPLPLEVAIAVAIGVAAGLHHAHEKRRTDGGLLGLVHRDVSPSNVVVTFEGGVKLVDFGLAKMTAHSSDTSSVMLKGKPAYMSPEQCRGEPLDRRSDLFSLAVVLYEMTTLTRLFKGVSDLQSLKLVEEANVVPPSARISGYPAELERIVLKSLRRRRDDRYADAREVESALERFARGHGLAASSARIGEWMRQTFGEKREPWATGTFVPPDDVEEPAALARARHAEASAHTIAAGPIGHGGRPRARTPARATFVGIAAGIGGCLLGGALLLAATMRSSSDAQTAVEAAGSTEAFTASAIAASPGAPSGPAIGATNEMPAGGAPASPGAGRAPSPLPAPATLPGAPAPAELAATARRPPPGPRATRARTGMTAARRIGDAPEPGAARNRDDRGTTTDFSATFARRQQDLAVCFTDHLDQPPPAEELQVRFRIERDGSVASAEVQPAAVGATKLGVCISAVARSTRFAPQGEAVTVRIPVRVRLKKASLDR